MSSTNFFQVTRGLPGNVVSAMVPFAAPRGLMVAFNPAFNSAMGALSAQFIQAHGIAGFALERDVLTTIPLEYSVFFKDYVTPEKVGQFVTARKPEEIIVEGLDLVLTSGTGALSGNTAANTALGLFHGQWYVKQGGDEVAGILREQMPVDDPANICRLRIEIPQ